MIAAEQGNLEIVKELIKNGANCNLEDLVYINLLIICSLFSLLCFLFFRGDSKGIIKTFTYISTLPSGLYQCFF